MKMKRKSKAHPKHRVVPQTKHTPSVKAASKPRQGGNTEIPERYTPMETGQPDQDAVQGSNNPAGAQGCLGPLNQEGEGDRQNDQLAELEQITPDLTKDN